MRHLKDSKMGYFEHLGFALKLSGHLAVMALIGVTHAIIPFIFQNTVSSGVQDMNNKLQDMAG
tara:strand:+ start:412 stop:600 length:189 start_codon:yes stop_codon:yes gene_type:complete